MKMASSRLCVYNLRSGLPAFLVTPCLFTKTGKVKLQINLPPSWPSIRFLISSIYIHTYIHTYIPTFSEHSGLVLWLLKLVHRPGIPKFLNCSNVKWDYIYFKKYWSGLLFPSPGDLPDPGIKPGFPTLQAESLQSKPPEKPSQRPRMSIWPQLPNIQSNCLHCTSLAVSDNIPYLGYYCLV